MPLIRRAKRTGTEVERKTGAQGDRSLEKGGGDTHPLTALSPAHRTELTGRRTDLDHGPKIGRGGDPDPFRAPAAESVQEGRSTEIRARRETNAGREAEGLKAEDVFDLAPSQRQSHGPGPGRRIVSVACLVQDHALDLEKGGKIAQDSMQQSLPETKGIQDLKMGNKPLKPAREREGKKDPPEIQTRPQLHMFYLLETQVFHRKDKRRKK